MKTVPLFLMRIELHDNFRFGFPERLWHPGYYTVPRDMPQEVALAVLKNGLASEIKAKAPPENKALGLAPQNKMLHAAPENKARWSGLCVVAATGPSLTEEIAAACKGKRCIAVNDAYRLFPFADVLYAADSAWWELHKGCPDFRGEKWTAHEKRSNNNEELAKRYGLHLVQGRAGQGFSLDPERIHYGSNSGFQAVNLAVLFGATRIVLVGFDMRRVDGKRHFFGDHPAPLSNSAKYERFVSAFKDAAKELPSHIEVINCTPGSALKCFRQMPLEAAL